MSPARPRPRPADVLATTPGHPAVPVSGMPAPAPGAGLRRLVVALTRAHGPNASDVERAHRWPPEVDPPGTPESRERLARTGERQLWGAQDAAQAAFAGEVAAYTRALRDGGMTPRQVLAAVAAVVREAAAPSLAPALLDAMVHDGGRYSVEAFFAR
jgi:hypothetical protein